MIASVAREPGYRELGLTSGTLDGRPAEQWEFMVVESGVLLHKGDVFFASRSGTGSAVLTSAPADAYASLSKRFAALRRSLAATLIPTMSLTPTRRGDPPPSSRRNA